MISTGALSWKTGHTQAPLPPLAEGLPVIGNTLALMRDPLQFAIAQYRHLGPIFRVRTVNGPFTVLAGPDANLFLSQAGDAHLTGMETWATFGKAIDSEHFLAAMDGEPHFRQRAVLRRPYSREAILQRLPGVIDLTRNAIGDWQPGQSIAVVPFIKRLFAEQIGHITLGTGPGAAFNDLDRLMRTLVNAVLGQRPVFTLRLPRFRRTKARLMNLADRMLEEHRLHPANSRQPDLVDYLLQAAVDHPDLFGEAELRIGVLGPYLVGIDTAAGTTEFMLYALLKHPETLARLVAEVDAAFADGLLTADKLRAMPILHATAMETLRRYPVAPLLPRTATQPFEFAGYRVDAGQRVITGTAIAHFDSRLYPNPEVFDIDRCLTPRLEHRQPGAFAPFGFGAHTCAGASLAEVEIMVTIACLVHAVELALDPPDYELKVIYNWAPAPDRNFRVRVVRRRH